MKIRLRVKTNSQVSLFNCVSVSSIPAKNNSLLIIHKEIICPSKLREIAQQNRAKKN